MVQGCAWGDCVMSDIRLQREPLELNGKTYLLRCNFNVLADVQEAFGGDFLAAMDDKQSFRAVTEFTAAMANDYADEMGWPERFTARQIGRLLPMNDLKLWQTKIAMLVLSALGSDESAENEGDDPNAATTQS